MSFDPATHLAVLPYSSGTTGRPKGVMLTHRNLVANVCQIHPRMGISAEDKILAVLPFFHIYGMTVLLNAALYERASLVTMPRFDLVEFLRIVAEQKCTYIFVAPPVAVALAKHPLVDQYDLSSVHTIFSGAAPLDEELGKAVANWLSCRVRQGYGMSEMSPVSHAIPFDRDDIVLSSVGPTIANMECKLVDPATGEEVDYPADGVSQPGELWCKGPNIMVGYLGNEQATRDTLDADGYLHTGDIATVDAGGVVTIVDRLKKPSSTRATRCRRRNSRLCCSPTRSSRTPRSSGCFDDEGEEVPKAFVVWQPDTDLDEDGVIAFVAERVSPHKKVRKVGSSTWSRSPLRARSSARTCAPARPRGADGPPRALLLRRSVAGEQCPVQVADERRDGRVLAPASRTAVGADHHRCQCPARPVPYTSAKRPSPPIRTSNSPSAPRTIGGGGIGAESTARATAKRRHARIDGMSTGTLVLLRHGESEWNALNLFTGWVDVHLTDKGMAEGKRAGELLAEHNLLPDVLYTSLLRRAISTANLALDACDRHWIPVVRDWRLNERHYGALQGKNKAQTKAEFGEDQFMLWRRSYDTPPPAIEAGSEYSQDQDARYADLPEVPLTECLLDVVKRLIPYWDETIAADLKAGKTVLVTAHGNSLRALVKHLDGISDEDIAGLNIPTGIPLRYDLDENLEPLNPGGTYLDPAAAAAGAAAVANQGAK